MLPVWRPGSRLGVRTGRADGARRSWSGRAGATIAAAAARRRSVHAASTQRPHAASRAARAQRAAQRPRSVPAWFFFLRTTSARHHAPRRHVVRATRARHDVPRRRVVRATRARHHAPRVGTSPRTTSARHHAPRGHVTTHHVGTSRVPRRRAARSSAQRRNAATSARGAWQRGDAGHLSAGATYRNTPSYVLVSHRLRGWRTTHTHTRTTDGPDRPDRCCTAHLPHWAGVPAHAGGELLGGAESVSSAAPSGRRRGPSARLSQQSPARWPVQDMTFPRTPGVRDVRAG